MIRTEVLVVGSGIAGLFFALRAARFARVVLVTKKDRPESSTNYAQGGIAAVFGADDTPELHRADTLVAGAGLCHRNAVEILVREGPRRVRELLEQGVRFTRSGGALSLGHEGGHSRRRIVRADDLTGREIERALLAAVAESPNVEVLEDHAAVDLLFSPDPGSGERRCRGALVFDVAADAVIPIVADVTLLATGGSGQVYRHTTNPTIATGDGVAMALRAGAKVANLEFVQFHPTALYPADARSFLISEAVRGEGATLLRPDGTLFMEGYHARGSLAPRDVVARAIDREMKERGDPYVLLDCSPIPQAEMRARFPNILAETAARGIDILREPIPVVPAAHYQCGGVLTDMDGRTSLAGLFAAGEAACTGVHGANRLASNSLLEAVVVAHRAAEWIGAAGRSRPLSDPPFPAGVARQSVPDPGEVQRDRERLRSLMWERAGIVRSTERLMQARSALGEIAQRARALRECSRPRMDVLELRNLVYTATLIVECALLRRESRGLHFNLDHPDRDNERWLRDTVVSW